MKAIISWITANWIILIPILGFVFLVIVSWWAFVWRRRTPPAPSSTTPPPVPRASRNGGRFIALVILLALVGVGTWQVAAKFNQQRLGSPQKWEWYWKLADGQYMDGRNESAPDERVVTCAPQSDGSLRFTLEYIQYGERRACRIHIAKDRGTFWSGTWEQDKPEGHGTINVDELAPNAFGGTITWSTDEIGRCRLKKL